MDYGVTMDLQKKSFIEPAKSCPDWLKIKLWKELGLLVQKYRIAIKRHFYYYCILSNTSSNFISDMGVTDHRHYDQ